jgi:hypothetical protein
MKHLQEASKELMGHLLFALNHSLDLKRDGVDPMMPFAVVIKGEEKTLKAFAGDGPEYGDKMFEKTIEEERPDYVVYASDSYMTMEGTKYDAVLFKAYDKTDTEVYLVGQRFRPKSEGEEFKQLGNPGFLGTVENPYYTPPSSSANGKKPWWKVW